MQEKLLEVINTVRLNKGQSPLTHITDNMRLRQDCGFDSFDLAELTVRIEEALQVDIFAAGVVKTIGEVLRRLPARGGF